MDDGVADVPKRGWVTPVLLGLVALFFFVAVVEGAMIWAGMTVLIQPDVPEGRTAAAAFGETLSLVDAAEAGKLDAGDYGLRDGELAAMHERVGETPELRIIGFVEPHAPSGNLTHAVVVEYISDDSMLGDYYTIAWKWQGDELVLDSQYSTLFTTLF